MRSGDSRLSGDGGVWDEAVVPSTEDRGVAPGAP
jgi:hypothetical protein